MTFTEAAEVVLRKVGKPLHYKKITQFAIEQNLLSHIGKTPEVTMSTRLATLTKKDRGDQNIQRVGPGIFGLREWGEVPAEALTEAVADASDAPAAAPAAEPTEGADATHAEASEELLPSEPARPSPGPALVPDEPEEPVAMSAEEVERNQRIEAAQEIFPEDDDDNEPVLGGGEKVDPKGRRRRRRRRRGERDDGTLGIEGEDAPLAEGAALAEGEERPRAAAPLAEGEEAPAGESTGVVVRKEEQPRRDPPRREEGRRDDGRRERRGDDRRDEGRRDEGRRDEGRRDEGRRDDRIVEEGISGRDTADMIVAMLTRREDRQPVGLRALADESTRNGRIGGDPTNVIPMLAAAARMDGVRRAARGERARLRITGGRVGLVDWTLPPELLRAEADAIAALERLRDLSRRYVVRRLNELPQAAFTESVVLLLERLGISSLKVTRRSGLQQGEVHLAGVARRGPEESPVAVVIRRGGEIGRERVIDVRGSLHHYNGATAAWIITTGTVLSGAREEAAAAGATPVTLIDGVGFGRLLDEHAVCVSHATVGLPYLDVDLFDALRNA